MNSTAETSTYRSDPVGSRKVPRTVWPISAAFVLGLVVFVLLVGRGEVSRWYFASTRNALQDERYADAIQAADAGLRWAPEYSALVELRALARYKQKDFEGCLRDYDQMILLAARDAAVDEDDMRPMAASAGVLQRLGRYQEAIAKMATVVDFRKEQFKLRDDSESRYDYALALNNRAYMQAQAKLDVARALKDIQLALDTGQRRDDFIMLDTLGYLQLLNGEHAEALETLTAAVNLAQQDWHRRRVLLEDNMQKAEDQRPYEAELRQLDENFSIILHHRGEAYRAVGEEDKAAEDIKEAKRLGYNPDEGVW